jgi:hypothetical protein
LLEGLYPDLEAEVATLLVGTAYGELLYGLDGAKEPAGPEAAGLDEAAVPGT